MEANSGHRKEKDPVTEKDEPAREPVFERIFGNLFGGSGHTQQEEKVREYIGHRLGHGAHLEEVLQEEYVRRNCSQEKIDAIIRDPRLIHEDRVSLHRLFESGELAPVAGRPRRESR